MMGEPSWEQERPVSAPIPAEEGSTWGATLGVDGSDEAYKRADREVAESGAGVGAAHSTGDAEDNRTLAEGRGRTWSVCRTEERVGECRRG
jgi:hypothetical protein